MENGLLQGSGGKLRPQAELTRAELAAVLTRAFGATESAETAFTDVEQSDWFAQAVARAVRMGAFQGDGAQMRPNDPITRQEVFTVLARAFQLNGGAQEALDFYADSGEVASWAADAMTAMVTVGYVKGDEGLLRPQDNITREEFAKVMDTLVSDYITEAGTYTSVAGGSLVISKTASGGVRVVTADGAKVRTVYVADGNDDVVLEGAFESVTVETPTPVVLREGQVENLTVAAGRKLSRSTAAATPAPSP